MPTPDNPLYLLTGPIRSGKTTALMNALSDRPNISGLLMPDLDGTRQLFDIGERKSYPFQSRANDFPNEPTITIGRFTFLQSGFERARQILAETLRKQPEWLIVDELGPLELKGQGFEPHIGRIIHAHQHGQLQSRLLIVVRDYLLADVIRHYQIQRYQTGSAIPADLSNRARELTT